MKKIIALLLLMLFVSNNTVIANIIPKIELGNLVVEDEYPSSDLVEPIVPIEENNMTIEGGVEATPDVVEVQNSFSLEDCLRIIFTPSFSSRRFNISSFNMEVKVNGFK